MRFTWAGNEIRMGCQLRVVWPKHATVRARCLNLGYPDSTPTPNAHLLGRKGLLEPHQPARPQAGASAPSPPLHSWRFLLSARAGGCGCTACNRTSRLGPPHARTAAGPDMRTAPEAQLLTPRAAQSHRRNRKLGHGDVVAQLPTCGAMVLGKQPCNGETGVTQRNRETGIMHR